MGSKPKQANPAQASASFQAASGAAQGLQSQASQAQSQSNALSRLLFGDVAKGPLDATGGAPVLPGDSALASSGGTLSRFLDPASLNVSEPTGTYGLQYQRALQDIAQGYQNQRGALARELANRGFGANAPAGFGFDLYRQLGQGQADTQGQAFTDYAARAYQDALRNFWGATALAANEADTARSAALRAQGQAADTYGNLYGTAGRTVQGSNVAGPLIRTGGLVATAGLCPVEGSKVLMADGSEKPVEELRAGEKLAGVDGAEETLLAAPEAGEAPCVALHSSCDMVARASASHTLLRDAGGYVRAAEAEDVVVKTSEGPQRIKAVEPIGTRRVYRLRLDRSHTFRHDGFWAEE